MSVWFAIPSKRPAAEAEPVLALWRQQGYKVALFVDEPRENTVDLLMVATHGYPGYAAAVNSLVAFILAHDKEAEWIVTGGDDIEPDLNHMAEQIARQTTNHFLGTHGVMQPTGDRWGENPNSPDPRMRSAYIDRVCGSPWMGREFCRRMYNGAGPLHPGYRHMYEDEELFEVANAMGVLWQRRDLIQMHRHWARKPGTGMDQCPEFLQEANSPAGWASAKALFDGRKRAGFPGHQPCV